MTDTITEVVPAWTEDDLSRSVYERFHRVAAAVPDLTAVADASGRDLSFRELARVSLAAARDVLSLCEPGSKVGLLSDLSVGTIAGLFGISAAGGAYVPIDSTEPAGKAGDKIESSGATVMVLTPGLEQLAREMAPHCRQVIVDIEARAGESPELPDISPDDHFNLIFTSGSTGQPKGVVQTHRNVLFDTSASSALFPIRLDDAFGLAIPLTFGASVSDVMGALLNGARLELFDVKAHGIEAMAGWMADRDITVTHLVPTVIRRWLSSVRGPGRYPKMRMIRAGGEPLFSADLDLFSSKFQSGYLRNGLGTTETYLVASAVYAPGDTIDTPIVPIGDPAPGRRVTIVGADGRRVPDGEVGEIHVTSAYLSPGYWNDLEGTAASYVDADDGSGERTYRTGDLGRVREDGQLEHLGRVDDMVKVAGQRVHLTNIETTISSLVGVKESSVAAKRDESGDTRLVAYVVVSEDFPGASQARARLVGRLPAHMVPSRFIVLDSLPTLPFGKVDRRALALRDDEGDTTGIEHRAPRNETETALAEAAAAALGIDSVGIDHDLFGLGLDSLSAVQVVARVREALGVRLAIDALFENPTIATLAEALENEVGESTPSDLESLLADLEEIGESGAREVLDTGPR